MPDYIIGELTIPAAGVDPRFESTAGDIVIGGNLGDVLADGVWVSADHVTLHGAILRTTAKWKTDLWAIAYDVVHEAYVNAGADVFRPVRRRGA